MFPFCYQKWPNFSKSVGLKPGDSCINQIVSITHELYKSFDDGFDVRSVFLDVSKAFYKLWHEGIILKLKQNGISAEPLNLLCEFLGTENSE